MKNLKAKLRTASFWVTLVGALTLILTRFGYENAASLSENIVEGIASVLLVLGIITAPPNVKGRDNDDDKEDKNDKM